MSALVVAPGTARAATLFAPPITYVVGSGPADVAVGDLTGDGNDSLAVANTGNATVSVLLGNGDGTLQPPRPYLTGAGPSAVTAGDFNGDDTTDLAAGNTGNATVSGLLGNGDGTAQTVLGARTRAPVLTWGFRWLVRIR